MNCANKNGFSIIRILQKDVYYTPFRIEDAQSNGSNPVISAPFRGILNEKWCNKYDWLNDICENIENITNNNRVQNIYMCKNNEYKDFDI